MSLLLNGSLLVAQTLLGLAACCSVLRMLRGPRAQDRVLGLDSLYINVMLLVLTFGIRYGTAVFFEIALLISLVGFAGTVALAKFLMRGEVIE